MYIVYSSHEEVIVCTVENEAETIQAYFTEGGRDIEEYDRVKINNHAVTIEASLRAK